MNSFEIAFFSKYITIKISADLLPRHFFSTNHVLKSETEDPIKLFLKNIVIMQKKINVIQLEHD